MRLGRGGVGKDVAHHEQLQLVEQRLADAVLRDVFAEDNQRFDRAALDARGDVGDAVASCFAGDAD